MNPVISSVRLPPRWRPARACPWCLDGSYRHLTLVTDDLDPDAERLLLSERSEILFVMDADLTSRTSIPVRSRSINATFVPVPESRKAILLATLWLHTPLHHDAISNVNDKGTFTVACEDRYHRSILGALPTCQAVFAVLTTAIRFPIIAN